MSEIKPFAFVLMPFSKEFRDVYELGIKPVAKSLDIVAERVDEQHFTETILERIYRQIDACDFIVADMTDQNPNVFYEVGYAHAKQKPCILITRNSADIPFDLKHHTHIIYDGTVADLKEKITPKLEWLKEESEKAKTETLSLSLKSSNPVLARSGFSLDGSMTMAINLRNESDRRSPEIEAIYVSIGEKWTMRKGGTECPFEHDRTNKTKRFAVTPDLRRISPGAFSETRVEVEKRFWSKFSGEEEKELYTAKGNVIVEIATSEGTFKYERSITEDFEVFPF